MKAMKQFGDVVSRAVFVVFSTSPVKMPIAVIHDHGRARTDDLQTPIYV